MTDALTNAERLLREDCELRYEATGRCPAGDGACSRCVAADALAAERERREEPVLANYPCSRCANRALSGSSFCPDHHREYGALNAALAIAAPLGDMERELVAIRAAITKTAAPPLPPATGEGRALASDEQAVMDDFIRVMRDEAIPAIVAGQRENAERIMAAQATRILSMHGTERAMHRAWRKRAEECESARPTPEPSEAMVEAAQEAYCASLAMETASTDYSGWRRRAFAAAVRAALAAQEGAA